MTLQANHTDFLGSGDMGMLIRSHDWSASSFGSPETWPASLRTIVGLMLNSRFPMFTAWGPDLTCVYNNAYTSLLGKKHPSALGAPFRQIWAEIWEEIAPLVDRTLAGEVVYFEDLPLILQRSGYEEQAWFTFSYSPVRDEEGKVAGLYCVCTETTQKVLAQRHLAAESERLRALFRQAPGFMAVLREPNHIFEMVNEAHIELVGRRDMIGRPVREAMPELEGQGFFELLDRTYQSGKPFVGYGMPVKLQRRPDSPAEDRFITFVFQPIRDEKGHVSGIFAEGHDVTDAKRTEEALRRSETHLARAQQVAGLGSWELDIPSGQIVWSEETFRLYGLDPGTFEPTLEQVMARFHHEDLPRVEDHLERLLTDDATLHVDARFERGDGEFRWGTFAATRLTDKDGVPTTLVGVVQDITERRQAEEALRESELQARAVIEASPDAFIRLDQDGVVTEWNRQAESLFGWSREEALGQILAEMVVPEDMRSAHGLGIGRHKDASNDLHLNRRARLEAINRDGERIPVELTIVSTPQGDRVVFNGFVRDLRDSIEVETRLRQAQKMEAVGQLTGGVAHDFNNLLAIAIGNLDVLDEETPLDSSAKELLESARDACLRGADLTGRLLAFARQQTLQPRATDVNGLISEYSKLLGRLLGADIELQLNFADGLWEAMTDPGQLEAAITNLATNARDAMPKGGRLTISTRNEQIDAHYAGRHPDLEPGNYVAIEVSDTGHGMTPEVQARAVDPFYTTKEVGKGTGLGLSMVFGFTKQSSGHLRIYSEVARGTAVTLLLPRAEATKAEETPVEPPAPRAKAGETILLVEDNPSLRRIAAGQLASLGYTVLEAEDGPSALEILASDPGIDLLLTDIIMPGGFNGVDLGREARQLRPGIKLIYMSGFPESAFGDRARLDPDIILMRKPFRKLQLAQQVREGLDRAGPNDRH